MGSVILGFSFGFFVVACAIVMVVGNLLGQIIQKHNQLLPVFAQRTIMFSPAIVLIATSAAVATSWMQFGIGMICLASYGIGLILGFGDVRLFQAVTTSEFDF